MQLKSTTAFQLDAVESDLKGFTYSSSVTTSTIRRALLQTVTTYVTVQLCYIYKENSTYVLDNYLKNFLCIYSITGR